MNFATEIYINQNKISYASATYFIADIAANHDGDLQRAKDLIWLAKEAGASAVKFQHFKAKTIVSDYGFRNLGSQLGHQACWKKTVYEVYEQYECDRSWTSDLVATAKKAAVDFFTAPYDYEALDLLDSVLPAYKIGSGDITWLKFIQAIAQKGKPVFLATGAADMVEVEQALEAVLKHNDQIVLMQCNTNYTGNLENFRYVNLRVLSTYAVKYPGMILGLSDHTPLHAAVLGAIALGARVIEKHFTDDNARVGPDHSFAMNPKTWREMVERSRELEAALGDGIKRIEENEKTCAILQRRCIRLVRPLGRGDVVSPNDVEYLRPAPEQSFKPSEVDQIIGKKLLIPKQQGDALYKDDVGEATC